MFNRNRRALSAAIAATVLVASIAGCDGRSSKRRPSEAGASAKSEKPAPRWALDPERSCAKGYVTGLRIDNDAEVEIRAGTRFLAFPQQDGSRIVFHNGSLVRLRKAQLRHCHFETVQFRPHQEVCVKVGTFAVIDYRVDRVGPGRYKGIKDTEAAGERIVTVQTRAGEAIAFPAAARGIPCDRRYH